MSASTRAAFIALSGLVLFAIGAWLRFNADNLGTVRIQGVPFVAHSAEYIEISRPITWCGAGLVVLASSAWLFSARRESANPRSVHGSSRTFVDRADAA